MHIEHLSTCPAWCDPRTHIVTGPEDMEHRTAGLTWEPFAADTQLTVSTVSLENRGELPSVTDPMVYLEIRDVDDVAGTDLDPDDAEMLAAVLVCEARRVRALRRAGR